MYAEIHSARRCTDNRVVRYSRLRMRIYQIQVYFEMQFAKRPETFLRVPGARFIQIRYSKYWF